MTDLLVHVERWRLVSRVTSVMIILLAVAAYASWQGVLDVPWWVLVGVFVLMAIWWQFAEYKLGQLLKALSVQAQFYSRQAFDSLYERSPVAYILISANGRIQLANSAAVNLLGATIDTISGNNFYDNISVTSEVATTVLQTKIERGAQVIDTEIPITTFSGEEKWVLISVSLPNDPQKRLVSMVDVTEQKAVDTAKSEFVALATHQLRTPIAAIRWNVELLERTLRESKTEKQAKYLDKVTRNVSRMISLINDFLSVSKLEMGTFAAEPEEVVLREYLDEILQEFDEQITNKQLVVEKQADPPDMIVRTDRRLFHIVFSNLVSNAVKYTPSAGTLRISIAATGGSLVLTVADSGMGIPEDELPQLFTKFYRASNATASVAEGTGLGLYVVKQSVEIMGGTISVESIQDKGATFVVQLPSVVVSNR